MLEDEIEDLKDETDPDIKSHFIREDAEKIRELLKGDDLFYVYRGFLVDEDEYKEQERRLMVLITISKMLVKVFPIQLTRKQQCISSTGT